MLSAIMSLMGAAISEHGGDNSNGGVEMATGRHFYLLGRLHGSNVLSNISLNLLNFT